MENLRDLEKTEMRIICGGLNPAYEIGYAIGSSLRHAVFFIELFAVFK
jgi:hypothetical protein